ncbi:major facilitator superfamily, putative [Trypanosoma equiperdum]|nr:major facilitator superfamily, putative [Trypanosoma equiperdum]
MEGAAGGHDNRNASTKSLTAWQTNLEEEKCALLSAVGSADGKQNEECEEAVMFPGGGCNVVSAVNGAPAISVFPAKVGYFGYYFALGSVIAFYGVIFTSKGMSPSHIGLLLSFTPLANTVLFPTVTYIADRFQCSSHILVMCCIASSFFTAVFLLSNTTVAALISFHLLVVTRSPISPLLDQHTLSIFPKEGRVKDWGALRSFGALGWGVGSAVSATTVDLTSTWALASFLFAAGQVGVLYCVLRSKPYEVVERTPMQFHEVFLFVLHHRRLLLFLTASCFMGAGFALVNNFLFVFLETLGGSKVLMGLSLALTVSTEIPIFQNAKYFQELFTDRQMLSISMATWMLRVVGYSLLQNPWLVLLLEPLHGITFGFTWLPGVHIVNTVFPPNLSNSATGFLYFFVNGIGPITGSVLGGAIYEWLGPRVMFRAAAFVVFCVLVLFVFLDRYLEKEEAVSATAGDTLACTTDAVVAGEVRLSGESERC